MKKKPWQWKPKPRGRRPRGSTAAKARITMRLTAEEHRAFRQAAGSRPISAWLRDLGNLCTSGRLRVEGA